LDHLSTGTAEHTDELYSFHGDRYLEAARQRITPPERADLHERYAACLEQRPNGVALSERIGHHLEQAYRHWLTARRGAPDEATLELARRAGLYYAAAGHSSIPRGLVAMQGAASTLTRAVALLPEGTPERRQAQLDLAETLQLSDPARAMQLYNDVIRTAQATSDRAAELHAEVNRLELSWFHHYAGDWQQDREQLERIIAELEPSGDALMLAKAWRLLAQLDAKLGRPVDALAAGQRALELARQAGDERLQAKITHLNLFLLFWSPAQLSQVARAAERTAERARRKGLYSLEAGSLGIQARVTALQGDNEGASKLLRRADRLVPDFPDLLTTGNDVISEAIVRLCSGDLEHAERVLERGLQEARHGVSSRSQLAHVASILARVLLRQGHEADAERAIEEARTASIPSEVGAQTRWRQTRALLLARRGAFGEAEGLARQAVDWSRRAQASDLQAQALADLAEVLRGADKHDEAIRAAEEARSLYKRREDRVHQL